MTPLDAAIELLLWFDERSVSCPADFHGWKCPRLKCTDGEYAKCVRAYCEWRAEEGEKEEEEARAWAEEEAGRSSEGVNVVTGKVLGADGRPVEGVRLTIRCSDGEHSVVTDGDGVYRLENLPPGEYTVLVGDEERKEYAGIEKKLQIGEGGGQA